MFKSDCQYSKVNIKWKMTEEHTEAAGTKEREGWAESTQASEQTQPGSKVPCGGVAVCSIPMF